MPLSLFGGVQGAPQVTKERVYYKSRHYAATMWGIARKWVLDLTLSNLLLSATIGCYA
jgi:hypothetical protein